MQKFFKHQIAEVQTKYKRKNMVGASSVTSSQDAYDILKLFFTDLTYKEQFFILLLDRSNNVLGVSKISDGGCTGTVVDGKIVFQTALLANAMGIVMCHNHPSGNLKPSDSDRHLTEKIKTFGKMIELTVLDHIIITDKGYYSFADEGIMD